MRMLLVCTITQLIIPATSATAEPGQELWLATFGGDPGSRDRAAAVQVSPDGTAMYVTGTLGARREADVGTLAYDAREGRELWSARFDGPDGDTDEARALTVTSDGSAVAVVGSTRSTRSSDDILVLAYDAATGRCIWTRRIHGSASQGDDEGAAVIGSPDGTTLYVAGAVDEGQDRGSDLFVAALHAASGRSAWVATFNRKGALDDEGEAVALSPDGSHVFVAGWSEVRGGYAFSTIALDALDGTLEWQTSGPHMPNPWDLPHAVAVSPDGDAVAVTGSGGWGEPNTWYVEWGYRTMMYDAATGSVLWDDVSVSNGTYAWDLNAGTGIVFLPDGDTVVATGTLIASQHPSYGTVAYGMNGGYSWGSRYRHPGQPDWANAIVAAPDSSAVYVTGASHGRQTGSDLATIAYSAEDGAELWVARTDDDAHAADGATAMAVSPDGSTLFVAGWFTDGGDIDFVTVAYSA